MKIKLMALVCAAVVFSGVLVGCGTETEGETTVQIEETTVAAEATTEPTEPPTLLEELGIELWDGKTPSMGEDYWVYDVPAKTMSLVGFNSGVAYYASSKQDYSEMLSSEIVDTYTTITIEEIPKEWITEAKPGEGDPYVSVANKFYQAYRAKTPDAQNKEDWLDGYKFLRAGIYQDVYTAKYYKKDAETTKLAGKNRFWPMFVFEGLGIVDQNTGIIFEPSGSYEGDHGIGTFAVEADGKRYKIMVQRTLEMQWLDNHNGEERQDLYVMVPKEYDGLAFTYAEFIEPLTSEHVLEMMEATSEEPWKIGTIQDKINEDKDEGGKKRYVFALSTEE